MATGFLASLRFRAGELDDLSPLLSLSDDELSKVGGRHRHRHAAERREPRLELQRFSILILLPPLMPASIKPCWKAVVSDNGAGRPSCKSPIAGSACCARTVSGHIAAAPPRSED